MVWRLLILLLLVNNCCLGQNCHGVLVRIKNTGTAETTGYTIEVSNKVYNYDGLKPGDSTAYICLPSFAVFYSLSMSFRTAGPISRCCGPKRKIIYHGKFTIELNTYKDSTVKTIHQGDDMWERFNYSEKIVTDK